MLNKEEITNQLRDFLKSRAKKQQTYMNTMINGGNLGKIMILNLDDLIELKNLFYKIIEQIEQLETELKETTMQRNKLATILSEKEDDKQKLIEKLENLCEINSNLYNSKKQKEVDFSEWSLAEEILEILKGEKNE